MNNQNNNKSTEEYWTEFWKTHGLPAPININNRNLKSYTLRNFDSFFSKTLEHIDNSEKKIIEIGCGNSNWLSYFHNKFGYNVSGIDYSSFGCEQTKKILQRDKIKGDIILGDLFNPSTELIGKFDVACSFGVIEHFNDTESVLRKISDFVKPGGIVLTTIPNLVGLTGLLQKWMNRPVYDIHKPMSMKEFEAFIIGSGLEIIEKELLMPMAFGVTLAENEDQKVKMLTLKKMILKGFQVFEKIIWAVDDNIVKVPKNELFCAGMMIAARKKLDNSNGQ